MIDKEKVTRLLTAIGDPARLEIMFLLGGHERLNAGDIAGHFRISRPAVSHHLKVLRDAGAVKSEKQGQEVYYWINRENVATELQALAEVVIKEPESSGSSDNLAQT